MRILIPLLFLAVSIDVNACTIVYSLKGLSQQSFERQTDRLGSHLRRQQITLVDLNNWYKQPPYKEVSGRERALLRKRYNMRKADNTAVLINEQGTVIKRYEDTVDLVDILLSCKRTKK